MINVTDGLGENLRKARRRVQWTQKDLADASGVAPATIARIELDSTDPRVSVVRKLADALDVGLLDLIPEKHTDPEHTDDHRP